MACVCAKSTITFKHNGRTLTAPVSYRCSEHAPDARKADRMALGMQHRALYLAKRAILCDLRAS
jgi:hypothetical protein